MQVEEAIYMAYYRIIVFRKPTAEGAKAKPLALEDYSTVDGYSYDGRIILVDTIRWLTPDMSEENHQKLFRRLLEKAITEAAENNCIGTLETIQL